MSRLVNIVNLVTISGAICHSKLYLESNVSRNICFAVEAVRFIAEVAYLASLAVALQCLYSLTSIVYLYE